VAAEPMSIAFVRWGELEVQRFRPASTTALCGRLSCPPLVAHGMAGIRGPGSAASGDAAPMGDHRSPWFRSFGFACACPDNEQSRTVYQSCQGTHRIVRSSG
jgi:hypothetical protein